MRRGAVAASLRRGVSQGIKSTSTPATAGRLCRGYKSTIACSYVVSPHMMLQERVDSDLKEAMRAKDTTKLAVMRMLKSALKYAAIAKSDADAELSDAEAVQVIRKQVKQRQDSIESFEKAGRAELVEKEKKELSILNGYLPQPMSADEISKVVRETIAETGANSRAQMGAVMKALQTKVAGRVDGKALSAEVQKQLSG
jgi:uncharacterized protein YqeY